MLLKTANSKLALVLLSVVASACSISKLTYAADQSRGQRPSIDYVAKLISQNALYVDWKKAQKLKQDQALLSFDWHQPDPSSALVKKLDPIAEKPTFVERFSLEGKDIHGWTFGSILLDWAIFRGSDLTGAVFVGTSLRNASFDGLQANPANPPEQTTLTNVLFREADLGGATFDGANMTGVIFEPLVIPNAEDIADAQNLERMTYDQNPSPLLRLRQAFRDGGFAQQDREINYAVHRKIASLKRDQCLWRQNPEDHVVGACVSFLGYTIADWTCQYGMNLWRPVQIGLVAWFAFALIYFSFMHHPGPSGLYLAVSKSLVLDIDDIKNAEQVRSTEVGLSLRQATLGKWILNEWRLLKVASFFSLTNGFNLGFKDADIGRWLHLLPGREFEFCALGWPRTFAGIQALITLYLVAIWILCMFGHPFG